MGITCVRPRRQEMWPETLIPMTLLWTWLDPSQRGKGLMSRFIEYRFDRLNRSERGGIDPWAISLPLTSAMCGVLRATPKALWPDNIGALDIYTGESRERSAVYRWPWWDLPLRHRMDTMLAAYRAGELSRDDARVQMLPLWSECIEDDSADLWLSTWRDIADGVQLTDADELPPVDASGLVRVYRGEGDDVGDVPRGVAWSTRLEVAKSFAIQMPWAPAPTVYCGTVRLSKVIAYIAWSGEFEVIVDPDDVTVTRKEPLPWTPMTHGAIQLRAFRHRLMLDSALERLQGTR
jgi:hypothetical protein